MQRRERGEESGEETQRQVEVVLGRSEDDVDTASPLPRVKQEEVHFCT